MTTTKWKVTGDHPILARPDKFGLSEAEATVYADNLRLIGYENVSVTEIKSAVMTATERAKEDAKEWLDDDRPLNLRRKTAREVIEGLLAECERLKEELADLKHADEIGYCRFELGKKLGIKTVETDCRVMTEAVVDAHKRTGETESYHPCTCPACVAAKKYLGGENE
jgi:hypothetical protein